MPPIRTAKINSSADAPVIGLERQKQRLMKPVFKGVKDATFNYSEREWDGLFFKQIGTTTRIITFGHHFVLTDDHIDDIAVLQRQVREKITQLAFRYTDVSYDAKNDAGAVTNQGAIRLATALPNLKSLELQGTREITDEGIAAFLKSMPNLKILEVSGGMSLTENLTGEVFDELREHPEWAPDLKSLVMVDNERDKEFMKSMRELTRARPTLIVSLVSTGQEKKWGDWELTENAKHYQKGWVMPWNKEPKGKRFGRRGGEW